jgi:hypothetical protein
MASLADSTSASKMSVAAAVNRGYNMLAAVVLGVIGFGFSVVIFGEPDLVDKIDNTILLIVGSVAVAWYFIANNRFRRSAVPILLGGVAVAGQILGIFIEIGDPKAIGDDFGALTLYLSTLVALVGIYIVNRRLATL